MSMELEYPFKIILYMAVVVILIGIAIVFRNKIINWCFFPPCENEKCDIKTQTSTENAIDSNILEKYCNICWEKNKRGECSESNVCNVVSLNNPGNPSLYNINPPVNEYCSISCSKIVTSFFVEYDKINRKIIISC